MFFGVTANWLGRMPLLICLLARVVSLTRRSKGWPN